VYFCEESLSKLLQENQLAVEGLRELDGKPLDFVLDFKVEAPNPLELVA
jgi:hypothetical protein